MSYGDGMDFRRDRARAFARDLREYAGLMRGLYPAGETSARAFVGGLRYPLAYHQPIWLGSRTVLDGRERVTFADGGALRVGLGPFGLSSRHDTSVVRVRPGAHLRCEGIVSLQRGVRVVVDAGSLTIGHGTNVNGFAKILVADRVTIGAGCTISWDAQILDNDFHPITVDGVEQPTTGPVVLGDGVWIGTSAIILKGVTVGAGSVVAAGAVVTRDVPPKSIVAGSPAKVVGTVDSWR